jgi:predicted esterase
MMHCAHPVCTFELSYCVSYIRNNLCAIRHVVQYNIWTVHGTHTYAHALCMLLIRIIHKRTEQTEEFFVEHMEAWRKAQGLNKMILCGHSLGGYLSFAYAERYPQHVDKLILGNLAYHILRTQYIHTVLT